MKAYMTIGMPASGKTTWASQQKGLDIVVSDTNLNQKYRNILVQKLIDLGYEIEYILFPISLDLAKERNNKRSRVVPEQIIESMFKSFQETKIFGKLLLGDNLISNSLISELNQLASLETLFPSSELKKLEN